MTSNLANLLGDTTGGGTGAAAKTSSNVVANPESGVISVRATARQQAEIAAFIKNVETRSLYQVLIEATVVEVTLGDKYQGGVDCGKPPISYTPDSFIKYCSSNFAGGMPSLLPCLRTGL